MHQLLAYIKFLYNSTNQHGVHSPFVYNLLTKCLYRKDKKPSLEIIQSYRKTLQKDERVIQVTDFGAGSRVFKSDLRKVSAIAKNAGISKKRAFLLNRLTSYLDVKSALELGTSVGISSAAIAAGNDVQLRTIEGCPETGKIAQEHFKKFGLGNVHLEIGRFEKIAPQPSPPAPEGKAPQPPKGEKKTKLTFNKRQTTNNSQNPPRPSPPAPEGGVKREISNNRQLTPDNHSPINQSPINHSQKTDLIYFDGNHQKEATLKYFNQLLPLAHNHSVFIFDDIHWSVGMEEAWAEIKQHPQVRVTIDSFFWGIVFFRKEQEKEHFILRL